MTTVNHRACAHEQQRLEERVRDEMEHANRHAADAEAHHHVTELRDGGICEYALDVVLRDGDRGGENSGDGADPSNEERSIYRCQYFAPASDRGPVRFHQNKYPCHE